MILFNCFNSAFKIFKIDLKNLERYCVKFIGPNIKKIQGNNNDGKENLEKIFSSCLGALKIIKDSWETEAIPETSGKYSDKRSFLDRLFGRRI